MDKFNKARTRAAVAAVVMLGALLGGAGVTYATPADPGATGAEFTALGDATESWVETYGVPVLGALLLVAIGVTLLIRWGKRAPRIIS